MSRSGNITANGATANIAPGPGHGREAFSTLFLDGSFDSATVQLQVSPDHGVTWFDAVDGITGDDIQLTAKGLINFVVRATDLRLNTTGVVTAADIDWWII